MSTLPFARTSAHPPADRLSTGAALARVRPASRVERTILVLLLASATSLLAQPGPLEIASVDGSGNPSTASNQGQFISGNGRFVVFRASGLLPADDNALQQIYLHDTQTGDVELISQALDGTAGDAASDLPTVILSPTQRPNARAISDDGRFVVFRSTATDLVTGISGPNPIRHVYLRDRALGTTQLVSISNTGVPANGTTDEFTMDPTGVAVAFNSYANNLDDDDVDASRNTYFWRRDAPVNERIRVGCYADDGMAHHGCRDLALSCGGGSLVFVADGGFLAGVNTTSVFWALPFVPDDGVGEPEAEVMTRSLSDEVQTGNHGPPAVNCAGNRVIFPTTAKLLDTDTDSAFDLYVRDVVTDQLWRVTQSDGSGTGADRVALSSAGGWAVFHTSEAIDPLDTNGSTVDAYRVDLRLLGGVGASNCGGTDCPIDLVSQAGGVGATQGATNPTVAAGGGATFYSTSADLHPNANGAHVYVEDTVIFMDGFETGDVTRWH